MRAFEYANPNTESEAVDLLQDHDGHTAVLAGGTDLVSLLKTEVLNVERVVDVKNIESMYGVQPDGDGVLIGALTTLEEALESPLMAEYRAVLDVIDETRAIQIQQMGTIGGDLCHLPNCWYFRNHYGLLGMDNGESLPQEGDNRYHAVFGNSGPAKFVSASRFAPGMIAFGAKVRVVGPEPDQEDFLPLEHFFIAPKTDTQGVTVLKPGQLMTHLWLPAAGRKRSATYEVLQLQGLDWPLAAAASCVEVYDNVVRDARIVMGHVAPTPWIADQAATAIIGKPINEETANMAADIAVADATPLSNNGYKVQLARTAVKRSLLKAVGKLEI